MSAKCRSCGAAIMWTVTKAGKQMPVDAKAVADGNVYVVRVGLALHSFSEGDVGLQSATRHTSHFATCSAPVRVIPENELAFAAGLIEGEGSVRINAVTKRNQGALVVAMTNTNRQLVDWMNERWPGYCKSAGGLRPDQKPAWVWVIAANQALRFLEAIEPYAVTDRLKQRIATARWWQQIKAKHWKYRTESDAEESFNCWHWMSELNRRGNPDRPQADAHRKKLKGAAPTLLDAADGEG